MLRKKSASAFFSISLLLAMAVLYGGLSTTVKGLFFQPINKSLQPVDREQVLKFVPWGKGGNLTMVSIGNRGVFGYIVTGKVDNNPLGFASYQNFKGKYMSLVLGKVAKSSSNLTRGEPQISIDFYLNGSRTNYQLVFINGRVNHEGWINNVYYNKLEPYSYRLVNLNNLLGLHGDQYLSLYRIVMTFEKKQTVNPFEFAIGLYNDTLPSS